MGLSQLQIVTDNGRPCGIPSNGCCVVEEYLPAGNLRNYLVKKRRTKLAFKVVIQLALDVVKGYPPSVCCRVIFHPFARHNMWFSGSKNMTLDFVNIYKFFETDYVLYFAG